MAALRSKKSKIWNLLRTRALKDVRYRDIFDSSWYIKHYNLSLETDEAAWQDFCNDGWRARRNPSQGFNTSWYVDRHSPEVEDFGNPLLHYILIGHDKRYNPHPLFDTGFYLDNNSDVTQSGVNALAHYLKSGYREGRAPFNLFDDHWYLNEYRDVARSSALPIYHYVQYGAAEGRSPSPLFDSPFYKTANADVPYDSINPLYHYVKHGRGEGRRSRPLIQKNNYADWSARNESKGFAAKQAAIETISLFKNLPTFSIVVPTYNTPLDYLEEMISSVINQYYPFWQLCIVDDASTDPRVRRQLEMFVSDPRMKISYNEKNMHIAGATNEALKLASGDYICLMDHDDLIAENALFEFALRLNIDPSLDFIYSDEDKLSLDRERYEPFFKPDWSPEYLESCMYTAHFACYRKSIVDAIGGFRSQCNGAQDYDFVLRFVQQTNKIGHIPKILYHWRAIPGSTAQSMDNKDYVIGAAVRALTDYLGAEGSSGTVSPSRFGGCFDLRRAIKGSPKVSIIIPTAGRSAVIRGEITDLVVQCVSSIASSSFRNLEIIVVHNGDLSQTTEAGLTSHDVRLIAYDGMFNVARKMNIGAEHATGDYLIFLNDDIEVISPDWIEAMLAIGQKAGVGCVGSKLLFENGTIQHAGVTFSDGYPDHVFRNAPGDSPGYFFSNVSARNWMAVTGACVLVGKDIFKSVEGFDERYAVNYNDIDLCLKILKKGYRNAYCPHAILYHFESQNRERIVEDNAIHLFSEHWSNTCKLDPFYSPYFDSKPPNFELAATVSSSAMSALNYEGAIAISPGTVDEAHRQALDGVPSPSARWQWFHRLWTA